MNVRKTTLIVLLAVIATSTSSIINAANGSNKTTRNIFYTASAIALLSSGLFQRAQSLVPSERYPLMQRRGILTALLSKEERTEKSNELKAELTLINEKIQALEEKNNTYNVAKWILFLASIGGIGGGLYHSQG